MHQLHHNPKQKLAVTHDLRRHTAKETSQKESLFNPLNYLDCIVLWGCYGHGSRMGFSESKERNVEDHDLNEAPKGGSTT